MATIEEAERNRDYLQKALHQTRECLAAARKSNNHATMLLCSKLNYLIGYLESGYNFWFEESERIKTDGR